MLAHLLDDLPIAMEITGTRMQAVELASLVRDRKFSVVCFADLPTQLGRSKTRYPGEEASPWQLPELRNRGWGRGDRRPCAPDVERADACSGRGRQSCRFSVESEQSQLLRRPLLDISCAFPSRTTAGLLPALTAEKPSAGWLVADLESTELGR
jgi:hypothetical protein